jgi:hypothetical protein
MSFDPHQNLSRAAERLRRSPAFIASLFGPWEKAFDETIVASLGADGAKIVTLGLCLRPREDHWVEDIEEIARACGLKSGKLAAFLRQALAAERLAASPRVSEIVDGRLLAARDRDGDSEE